MRWRPAVIWTGPSLAGVVGRKAGTAPGFTRYSSALKASGVVWDAASLDAWLIDPAGFVPGNRMPFPGLPEAQARSDVIAYLAVHPAGDPGANPPENPD